MTPRPRLTAVLCLSLLALTALAGCGREPGRPGSLRALATRAPARAERPVQAVQVLVARLRANDPVGYAAVAVPPALHAGLAGAWAAGRTRWPLDELPLDAHLPRLLASLSAPGAETALRRTFDRQFAGADRELHAAARSLGQFAIQFIRHEGDYSPEERAHHAQAVEALARWAATAPLGDRQRAHRMFPRLAATARRTGLASEADFARHGMDGSLRRLGPFLAATKQTFADYGLDFDASLDGARVTLVEQTGDTARVRLQYALAGQPVDAVLPVRRVDGHWYLADYLAHAQAAVEGRARPASP